MLSWGVGGGSVVYWLTLLAHPGNASLIAHLEPQNLIYLPSVDVLAVYQYTRTHVVLHITGWSGTLLSARTPFEQRLLVLCLAFVWGPMSKIVQQLRRLVFR